MKLPTAKLLRYPEREREKEIVSGAQFARSRSGVIISETGLIIVVINELEPGSNTPANGLNFSRHFVSFLRFVVYIYIYICPLSFTLGAGY